MVVTINKEDVIMLCIVNVTFNANLGLKVLSHGASLGCSIICIVAEILKIYMVEVVRDNKQIISAP